MTEDIEIARKLPLFDTIPMLNFGLRRQGRQFESAWGHHSRFCRPRRLVPRVCCRHVRLHVDIQVVADVEDDLVDLAAGELEA